MRFFFTLALGLSLSMASFAKKEKSATRSPQSVGANGVGKYVCYGFDGQIVIMGDGRVVSEGNAAFAMNISERRADLRPIKGTGEPESILRKDFEFYPVDKSANEKLPDLIFNHLGRNFILRCELD